MTYLLVGLLGLNGAGKTTILKILNCFMLANSGIARIDGLNSATKILKVRKDRRR